MTLTKDMAHGVWNTKRYYQEAGKASEENHPSLNFLRTRYHGLKILEVGCGEGTKLSKLDAVYRAGIDVSPVAVKIAKKKLDYAAVADATKLPFKDGTFDAALSFFSLEHFEYPEKVISEMIRVTKVGGELALLTPNFGAPNRSSPCYLGSRFTKLIKGFIYDFLPINTTSLNWHHVTPLTNEFSYQSDYDTVVEPYIRTLVKYLEARKFKIIHYDTNWDIKFEHENLLQKLFKFLGEHGIYPFIFWGPHCFVVAKKRI